MCDSGDKMVEFYEVFACSGGERIFVTDHFLITACWLERARAKAEWVVGLAQGSSGLEGQGVSEEACRAMVDGLVSGYIAAGDYGDEVSDGHE